MSYDLLLAFLAFAFVSSITPGPNNLMLMASGANYGFRRTLPHMLGVGLGFSLMVFLVGVGLGQVFEAVPELHVVLKVVSVLYLMWLAWKIAGAGAPDGSDARGKPFTFLQAAAFQWVNPKAWTMAVGAIALYMPTQAAWAALLVSAIFGLVNIPAVSCWVVMGQQMARILTNEARLRAFNWTMAGLLVLSLYPVLT